MLSLTNSALRYLRGFTREPLTSHLKSNLFRSAAKFRLASMYPGLLAKNYVRWAEFIFQ